MNLELVLADMVLQQVPPRVAAALTLKGPVQFYDPQGTFEPISYLQENIYSAACQPAALLPRTGLGTKPLIINDLRMCELALDLIRAACQPTVEDQDDCILLLVSRLVLEQSLRWPAGSFHAGMLLGHLNAEAADEVARRRHTHPRTELSEEENRYHIEQHCQFVLIHEATHYCLFADPLFRQQWLARARDVLAGMKSMLVDQPEAGLLSDNSMQSAVLSLIADLEACQPESLLKAPDLEEILCDWSAIASLVGALQKRGILADHVEGLMLSVWASMSAGWLLTMVRTALLGLLTRAFADVSAMADRLMLRASLALLFLTIAVGQALSLDGSGAQRVAVSAWRKQPDFEGLIMRGFNHLFSGEMLERVGAIGLATYSSQLSTPSGVERAIRRHFGWPDR